MQLAGDPQWLRLGHWRPTLLGGVRSEADGADFFLAPGGKRDPAAELEATLRGMYGLLPLTPDQLARKVQPAFCRFPARAAFLARKLQLQSLPAQSCPQLEDFWRRVQPVSATIIFSSYYLNNPASAFGHTFLRIHKAGDGIAAEKRELLDYGIDYSATADTTNPLLYAFKGIFGFFPGFFHIFPYYLKVREYNDYESRDLWEYDLSLTPEQVGMLVLHVYELGSTYFDYYYIDENCSYHLLAALEAAVPGLHLLDHLKLPVVPADTVKALYANPGLVLRATYRPSASTQLHARIAGMGRAQLDVVESLASDPESPVTGPQEQQIHVFDAAADLVDVRYAKELPFEPEGTGGRIKRRVLERRASILRPSPELRIPPPLDKRPDAGHGSGRFSALTGWSSSRGSMLGLSWRLSLHDLSDPPDGYPELAQIEFLPTQVRFYPERQSAELEGLDVVNATSLHAVSSFDHALSWRVRLGARRLHDGGCDGCLAGTFELGSGFAVTARALTLFVLGDVAADGARRLQGLRVLPQLRAGAGPFAGARLRLGDSGVLLVSGGLRFYPAAIVSTGWQLQSSLRWAASPGVSFGVEARTSPDSREALGQAFFYF